MIDEKTRLLFPSSRVTARDDVAEKGITEWDQLCIPARDYSEQVFEHEMISNSSGSITIGVINDKLAGGIGLYLRYLKDQFPFFAQWKQMGEGWYALGLEPGNCRPHGRHKQRLRGHLHQLNLVKKGILTLSLVSWKDVKNSKV